ncbi:hypothetical protein GH714_008918 [Hevea brasiliensis]|uniref:CCHC-type domain-containing protein n=1 Tax=Hevea brasiliensis TaxID=3981 RepID=A0A6A6LZG8_HEVBR|nr:hypothetical protein GH714_008918 [Hevea brasiliensis]
MEEVDAQQVLRNKPWCVHNQLLAIQEWPPNVPFDKLSFNSTPIWVQAHGLSPNQLNLYNAKLIGDLVGKYLEVDLTQDGAIGCYMFLRIRAEIHLDLPIKSGFYNSKADDTIEWIRLKYEKLPNVCYSCGLIGHIGRDCKNIEACVEKEQPKTMKSMFGPWLKVSLFHYPKKSLSQEMVAAPQQVLLSSSGTSSILGSSFDY